jgi:hypothetical protein
LYRLAALYVDNFNSGVGECSYLLKLIAFSIASLKHESYYPPDGDVVVFMHETAGTFVVVAASRLLNLV